MKIAMNVLRIEQHWILKTGEMLNYFVVELGGKERRFPATDEEVKAIAAQVHAPGAGDEPPEESFELDLPAPPIPVSEQGLVSHSRALGRLEDTGVIPGDLGDETTNAGGDLEFGGDFDPSALVDDDAPAAAAPRSQPTATQQRRANMAQTLDSRPRTKEKIVAGKLDRMRQIAQQPVKRVGRDDAGYPEGVEARTPNPVAAPTVVRRAPAAAGGDDDPFPQG